MCAFIWYVWNHYHLQHTQICCYNIFILCNYIYVYICVFFWIQSGFSLTTILILPRYRPKVDLDFFKYQQAQLGYHGGHKQGVCVPGKPVERPLCTFVLGGTGSWSILVGILPELSCFPFQVLIPNYLSYVLHDPFGMYTSTMYT